MEGEVERRSGRWSDGVRGGGGFLQTEYVVPVSQQTTINVRASGKRESREKIDASLTVNMVISNE